MPKPRTWLFIALGTLAILIGLALLVVGAGAWFFANHVKVEQAAPAAARERVQEVRARFAGETPLIAIGDHDIVSTAELQRRRASYSGPLPEYMKLLIWNEGDDHIVSLTFPFWLLRLKPDATMKIDVDGFRMDQLGVSNEDIHMAGPALVLDLHNAKAHVLVWTE